MRDAVRMEEGQRARQLPRDVGRLGVAERACLEVVGQQHALDELEREQRASADGMNSWMCTTAGWCAQSRKLEVDGGLVRAHRQACAACRR